MCGARRAHLGTETCGEQLVTTDTDDWAFGTHTAHLPQPQPNAVLHVGCHNNRSRPKAGYSVPRPRSPGRLLLLLPFPPLKHLRNQDSHTEERPSQGCTGQGAGGGHAYNTAAERSRNAPAVLLSTSPLLHSSAPSSVPRLSTCCVFHTACHEGGNMKEGGGLPSRSFQSSGQRLQSQGSQRLPPRNSVT